MRVVQSLNFLVAVGVVLWGIAPTRAAPPITTTQEFAPQSGLVASEEKPYRAELCLNGRWQFQPVALPAGFVRDQGTPPDLPLPTNDTWEATPVKVPSFWNVNTWGGGRDVGAGTMHPYWPGSVMYPSYPAAWDGVEMGWLRRRFNVPNGWVGKRLLLHFDAVAGDCQVWVNGTKAGQHFDSYTPFEVDATALLRPGSPNEVLVGIRHHGLFNKTAPGFPLFRLPYPNGSNMEALVGIGQDVSLIAVAPVHVSDAFVKPLVSQDRLEVEVTVRNDSPRARRVSVGATVAPWVNLAGTSISEAPVPRGKLGAAALQLSPVVVTVPAGGTVMTRLRASVRGRLKLWSPNAPNLNGLVVSVSDEKQILDRHSTRFGWRQVHIQGRDLLLNGKKIQLAGDLVHPFGGFVMSRRYAWAWYRMVKDFGGNAVRLHAQPLPRFYLDLADEMGLMVLDETALFGSSINLNFAEPVAWERFGQHYDALVLRDRNHPSVFGWSFGNELFAIFEYNKVKKPEADRWYEQLANLGLRARRLDSTREWISCDGDDDLRGTLPVWSKHLGHGLHLDAIPDIDKPRMIGESGGTYYAKPPLMAEFNGDRAFASYRGRNEALAIDAYQNVVQMARPLLTFFSASETVWFGLEHLPYGYRDLSRLPTLDDGVFFTRPYVEGKPGWQPERLPPYVATLNPGWDAALPLYHPLPMFEAMKAALAPGKPTLSPWDHRQVAVTRPLLPAPTLGQVGFVGPRDSALHGQLSRWGTPLVQAEQGVPASAPGLLVIDGTLPLGAVAAARQQMDGMLARGGTVLLFVGGKGVSLAVVNQLLPLPIEFTARQATMLVPKVVSPWTASLGMADLYFAEDSVDPQILTQGIAGPFVAGGETLLEAANIDWTLFDAGEAVKCGALVLYEQLQKPSGAALVVREQGKGKLVVCSIMTGSSSPARTNFWRKLLGGMGVVMGPVLADQSVQAGKEPNLLRDGPPMPPK